jgi:serine/threonine protein kinase
VNAGEPTFGPYRFLQRVAVGGMAEVFKATRTGIGGFEKVVAVKRLLTHLGRNRKLVDLFINEAKMVAGLNHPNIVQIFDLGKIDDSYFIAMEYVHGRDLLSVARRARERGMRMPMDLAGLVVRGICAALGYAHRKQDDQGRPMRIVHRDVSPQNILLSFDGEVKLTDFGIAKAATMAMSSDSGRLRGKLLYMSPEQAWGRTTDARSDLFSLGVVLYELLTDHKPFGGESDTNILEAVRNCRPASPSSLNPRVPEALERVVTRALQRDPDGRYQDAMAMDQDLERAFGDRRGATARELERFMDLLFDPAERNGANQEAAGAEPRHEPGGPMLELDFEPPPAPGGRPKPAEPSIEELLKRLKSK